MQTNQRLDAKTYATGGTAAVRSATAMTVGVFLTLCREYGRSAADFARANPSEWKSVLDADKARSFLVGG